MFKWGVSLVNKFHIKTLLLFTSNFVWEQERGLTPQNPSRIRAMGECWEVGGGEGGPTDLTGIEVRLCIEAMK